MPIITLKGCTPEPLGHYLKALGIFRLIAEQADANARAWWEGGLFCLSSKFSTVVELRHWLHNDCGYTAFVAPWLANTGWGKGGKRDAGGIALDKLLKDNQPRTQRFREASALVMQTAGVRQPVASDLPAGIKVVENWVGGFHKDDTGSFITQLRNQAPTSVLAWLDAVGVPRRKEKHYTRDWFPLFAKGGAEGSGNYIVRQQGYLADSFVDKPEQGERRLECALTGETMPDLLETSSLSGLFYPGFRGDPNIGQSFDSKTRANPWDFILLMEGLLFFRSATTRRLGDRQGSASFPFYCDSSLGGSPTVGIREIAETDKSISSGEIWCPLWDSPMTATVLHSLLGEGRFQVAGRTVKKAAQFALAVARFGCDRGIRAFLRYGLFRRSGSYGKKDQTAPLAVPLGVFPVSQIPKLAMLEELLDFDDSFGWRSSVYLGSGHNHPARLISAWAGYDAARFKAVIAAQSGQADEGLVSLLLSLGRLVNEFAVTDGKVRSGRGDKAKTASKPNVPLPPPLKREWASLKPELHLVEHRLARAIASILPWGESSRKPGQPAVGGLVTNLFPIARMGHRWAWEENSNTAVWSDGAPLLTNLTAVLHRRLIDGQSGKGEGLPLVSYQPASFADLLRLWSGDLDEAYLSDLIRALSLVDFGGRSDPATFDDWQAKKDSTPTLTQSGVWFDQNGNAILSFKKKEELTETAWNRQQEIEAAFALPRAFALLKLCFVPGRLPALPRESGSHARKGNEPYPNSPLRLLNLLLAGRSAEALQAAAHALRAKGYPPIVPDAVLTSGEWALSTEESQRLAGLLLIPIHQPGLIASLSIKPQHH
jgi:CRISPR-associated protein Csx17